MNNNRQSVAVALAKAFLTFIKIVIGFPVFFTMAAVCVYGAYDTILYIPAFVLEGVFPSAFILERISLVLIIVMMTLAVAKLMFRDRLKGLTMGKILLLMLVFTIGGGAFGVVDTKMTSGWRWAQYPPYIEQWETKVVYRTENCDYSKNVVFDGYLDFVTQGFKENPQVQIVEEAALTDRYRVEVYYKGLDSEMHIYEYDGKQGISLYISDNSYDYEPSHKDYAYMYKHKVNLEYSTPLAIEKIVIRTAYPEKIDISGIKGSGDY